MLFLSLGTMRLCDVEKEQAIKHDMLKFSENHGLLTHESGAASPKGRPWHQVTNLYVKV